MSMTREEKQEYYRSWYQKNKEKKDQYNWQWRRNNPEKVSIMANKRYKKYKPENLQKIKAKQLAAYALKTGKLKKGLCFICDSMYTEAHHEDYSKPLEVIWLCRQHHINYHRLTSR